LAIAFLALLFAACTDIAPFPTRQLVRQALVMQVSQTQAELTRQLHLVRSPDWEITRISIREETPMRIQNLSSFLVRGTYELRIDLPAKGVVRRQYPFELYLQRQKENKTWRLARPLEQNRQGDSSWATYLIKPPGYD
jgi:hypothetical protein